LLPKASRQGFDGEVTPDDFKDELAEALRVYDHYIVCLEKTPEQCAAALRSLLEKAIKAYENRAPSLRHGIALDRQVTIILSQGEGDRPLCSIYYNLYSPYHRQLLRQTPAENG
jgi:hypothetical protein